MRDWCRRWSRSRRCACATATPASPCSPRCRCATGGPASTAISSSPACPAAAPPSPPATSTREAASSAPPCPPGASSTRCPPPTDPYAASLVDVTHPYAIVDLGAAGLRAGDLDPAALNQDGALLARLEAIRGAAATALGLVTAPGEAAARSPAVPRLLLVSVPDGPDADLVTLAVTMGRVHRALPMTAALCGAAACRIPGTVPARACRDAPGDVVRLRHPKGIVEILVDADGPTVRSVGVVRTARRLMAGTIYLRFRPEL